MDRDLADFCIPRFDLQGVQRESFERSHVQPLSTCSIIQENFGAGTEMSWHLEIESAYQSKSGPWRLTPDANALSRSHRANALLSSWRLVHDSNNYETIQSITARPRRYSTQVNVRLASSVLSRSICNLAKALFGPCPVLDTKSRLPKKQV
jgi:hypothetical protein